MNLTKSPAGVVIASYGESPAPEPKKPLQLFTTELDDMDEVRRFLKAIDERGADLVSVIRYGTVPQGRRVLPNPSGVGYLVTFRHHQFLEIERKT